MFVILLLRTGPPGPFPTGPASSWPGGLHRFAEAADHPAGGRQVVGRWSAGPPGGLLTSKKFCWAKVLTFFFGIFSFFTFS